MLNLSVNLPKIETGPFCFDASRRVAARARPREWQISRDDSAHFIHHHIEIFNATNERWEPFHLWPAQADVLATLQTDRRVPVRCDLDFWFVVRTG